MPTRANVEAHRKTIGNPLTDEEWDAHMQLQGQEPDAPPEVSERTIAIRMGLLDPAEPEEKP